MVRYLRILLTVAAVVLAGCEGRTQQPAFQVRDSSGIRIIESFGPEWGPGEGWRIDATPLSRIGVLEGNPSYQFDGVTGAARLEDGTVVVADFGYQNVRFFDAEGRVTATVGGPGEGPGEFQGLSALGTDDSGRIWAYDFMLRRITWLDGSGRILRIISLDPEPPMLNPVGVLADGSFLLKQLWGATQVAQATQTGFRRDPVAFVRFAADGTLLDTLCLLPGRELVLTDEGGRGVMGTPPFGKNASGTIWRGVAVVGSTEAVDLSVLSPGGEAVRIVRLPALDLRLDPDAREEYIEGRLTGLPEGDRPGERARLEAMTFPETRPAFGGLVADSEGNLWVSDWVSAPGTPKEWKVLDAEGRWLGVVAPPPRFFPQAIGEDWVLGVEWDELDVEYVVIYPLRKEQAGA